MNENLKVLLFAVALAALVAAPAAAKSRTQQLHTAPAPAYRSTTVIEAGQWLGAGPDPRIRFELRRDRSSSWEAIGAAGSQ